MKQRWFHGGLHKISLLIFQVFLDPVLSCLGFLKIGEMLAFGPEFWLLVEALDLNLFQSPVGETMKLISR